LAEGKAQEDKNSTLQNWLIYTRKIKHS